MINKRLEERLDFNAHDLGEKGKFIRIEYAKNILNDEVCRAIDEVTIPKADCMYEVGRSGLENQLKVHGDMVFNMAIDAFEAKKTEIKKRYG